MFDLVLWGRRGQPLDALPLISARLLGALIFLISSFGTSRPAAGCPTFNKCSSLVGNHFCLDLVLWGRCGQPLGA